MTCLSFILAQALLELIDKVTLMSPHSKQCKSVPFSMEGQALYDLTSAHLSLLLCGPKVISSLWQEVCGRKFGKILTGFSAT